MKRENEVWSKRGGWLIKCKDFYCAALYVKSFSQGRYCVLLMSRYTHFTNCIYVLKWSANNFFPMIIWLEPKWNVNYKLVKLKEFFKGKG